MLLPKHIPAGYVVRTVVRDAILLLALTTGIYALQQIGHGDFITVPVPLMTVLGTAISLLLAFRTNQSYDRWWEARIIWGGIVNDSRSLVRQILTFPKPEMRAEVYLIVHRMAHRQMAWCYCLGRSLRKQDPLTDLHSLLDADELERLAKFDNKPNAMLLCHSQDLQDLYETGAIDSIQYTQIDDTIVRLCDHMGKCERIKSTVFPVTYSLFLRAFIYFFIATIPFGLGYGFGVSEIPLATAIGVAFFLIEKTATAMQDPFENRPTDTAVTTIATNIHRTLAQMIDEAELQPSLPKPHGYYSM